VSISWSQALAWRLSRQLLDPVGTESVAGVVRRLGAVPAQYDDAAELAIRVRRQRSRSGEVAKALADGTIIKTFAFRGAMQLLTPKQGADYLALRAASRMWELPSWQSYYRLTPSDWPAFRATVREVLADGPLTYGELGAALSRRRKLSHLGPIFKEGAWTLLKPLAWQGDMSFGPGRDGQATFQRLDDNKRWAGVPDLDDAGPRAVEAYVRSYGPTTPDHLQYWLGAGLSAGRKRITGWIDGLRDRLTDVDVDSETAFVMSDDVDELRSATPSTAVRLLPGFDQWVVGAGTKDPHVVPPERRTVVTRQANLVVAGGVVSGTWTRKDDMVTVDWFPGTGKPDPDAVAEEIARLGTILGRQLELSLAPTR
jgi:hypothetical protein